MIRFSFVLLIGISAGASIAAAQGKKITKPMDGPELPGLILRPGIPAEVIAEPKTSKKPDLAFGAYQRGYYLTALNLALPRAETGDPAAQTLVAEMYWYGRGVPRDRKKAAQWYGFAASGGGREAQFFYANMLLRGDSIPQDKKLGEDYMKKAADNGHPRAQFNLAQIITARRPTWAGFKQAVPYYRNAAESGVTDAQYAMANIHAEAKGVPYNDDEQAFRWLEQAAKGGLDTAQVELGIWLAKGRGTTKNARESRRWFLRAGARGNVIAQNRLARIYAFGVGTDIDRIKAGAWHIVSRRAGFTDPELDRIFATMSDINKKRVIEAANQLSKRLRL